VPARVDYAEAAEIEPQGQRLEPATATSWAAEPSPVWSRKSLLAAAAALVYTAKEVVDHGFDGAESAVLAGLIAALTLALTFFRRADLSWQPPEPLAAVLRL
jgi:hypothetical protein